MTHNEIYSFALGDELLACDNCSANECREINNHTMSDDAARGDTRAHKTDDESGRVVWSKKTPVKTTTRHK